MQSHHPSSCAVSGGRAFRSHQLHIVVELKASLRVVLALDKVHHQGFLNRKHGVISQVLVLPVEDLGSQRAVAFLSNL